MEYYQIMEIGHQFHIVNLSISEASKVRLCFVEMLILAVPLCI